MIAVIFFINAHMLIPTISGIMDTKDEQKIVLNDVFYL